MYTTKVATDISPETSGESDIPTVVTLNTDPTTLNPPFDTFWSQGSTNVVSPVNKTDLIDGTSFRKIKSHVTYFNTRERSKIRKREFSR